MDGSSAASPLALDVSEIRTAAGPGAPAEPEAFAALVAEAQRHPVGVAAEVLARQALAVTAGTDFDVARDALDALVGRAQAVKRDGIVVLRGPGRRGGEVRGGYRVGRRGDQRQYDVWLEAIEPPVGSCACADYGKSGLGLCKHLLAVLGAIGPRPARAGKAGTAGRAKAGQATAGPAKPGPRTAVRADDDGSGPWLGWDPVRPFAGAGDWLERVWWRERASAPRGRAAARVMALFEGGAWVRIGGMASSDGGRPGVSDGGRSGASDGGRPGASGRAARRLARLRAGDDEGRRAVVDALLAWIEGAAGDVAEPALAPLLRAERDKLERVAGGVPARDVLRHLGGLEQKLFPYQREGVRRFLADGRLLLADDMGLGKTAQAIAACHVLFAAGRVERGMIVVPAALKAQWAREWKQFTDLELTVVDGGAAERARLYRRRGKGVLLVNYEQVVRDLPLMQRFAPQVVVLDEAQRIKNWATKTAACVKRLDAPWRLVLTGTPMENRLLELSSILDWVDETALEPRWRLGSWHAVRGDGRREIVGARNLDTLRTRLRPCMVRRVRSEVMSQLPSRRDTLVGVPMTGEQLAAHADLDQPIARLAAQARRRPLAQAEFLRLMSLLTRQRIICNGLAQRDYEEVWPGLARGQRPSETVLARLASPKLVELRERIAALAIDQQRKVVVFSQWRRMLKLGAWAVSDLLADAGARAVFFTGEESQRRRTQNLVDFHDDPAVRVLFATDAGGVGLNLQKAASCVVNLDLPWNPAVLEQRIGRVHRFGQKLPVDVYALIADAGIESRIAGLVGDKKALFRGLFDGTSDTVEFAQAGSFLSRIERLLERPEVPAEAAPDGDGGDGPAADDSGDGLVADGNGAEQARIDAETADSVSTDGSEPAGGGAAAAVMAAVTAAAASTDLPASVRSADAASDPAADAAAVGRLLSQISIRPLADGRLAVEASPAAASAMATMLRSLAALLDSQAG